MSVRNAAIQRKMQRYVSVSLGEGLSEGLGLVGGCSNAVEVRDKLEGESLAAHRELIKLFQYADSCFLIVEDRVEKLNKEVSSLSRNLSETNDIVRELDQIITHLDAEKAEIETQELRAKEFASRFQLCEADQKILQGPISEVFLSVLRKVQSMHESCSKLLANDSQQQAAIDVLDQMYMMQISAYEKLRKHLSAMTADCFSMEHPAPSPFFVEGLATLSVRQTHWCLIMQEIARIRRTTLLRRFAVVISQHQSSGHDSSGDEASWIQSMLNWIISAKEEEELVIKPLFNVSTEACTSPELTLTDYLDTVLETTASSFSQAATQSIANVAHLRLEEAEAAVSQLFRIEITLNNVSEKLQMSENCAVCVTLNETRLDAMRVFFELLRAHTNRSVLVLAEPLPDSQVPHEVSASLRLLRLLCDLMTQSASQKKGEDMQPTLSAIIDPLWAAITSSDSESRHVIGINFLCAALAMVLPFEFCGKRQERLTELLDEWVSAFVSQATHQVCDKWGIIDRLTELKADRATDNALEETFNCIHSCVYHAGSLPIPEVEFVTVMRIRERCRKEICLEVCSQYDLFHDLGTAFLGDRIKSAMRYSPQQLRVLFDVDK